MEYTVCGHMTGQWADQVHTDANEKVDTKQVVEGTKNNLCFMAIVCI